LNSTQAWLQRAVAAPARVVAAEGDRRSAVLVPFVQRADGPALLFVEKAAHLRRHAGQIAFPGGALDAGETPEQAALREAWEEIGLAPEQVALIGRLDEDRTYVTGFHIAPVVGWIAEPPPAWQADAGEVTRVHEVLLRDVVDAEPVGWLERKLAVVLFRAPRYELPPRALVVWGATARILHGLQERLRSTRP
jgi:8-oxo-dGTP pyrophosphatase MutT (NUDIX family)